MDWNEDGLKDLLTGGPYGQIFYYRNIGTAGNPLLTFDSNLQVGGSSISVGGWSHPWVDDWDEDGRKDLLVGADDGRVYLYINVGTNANPVFNTTQWITLASSAQLDFGYRSAPSVVDLNGDSIKDLISGETGGYMYYCQNNGTNENPLLADPIALYTGWIAIEPGGCLRAAVVDWNEDGDIDMLVGCSDARLRLYLQTATTVQGPLVTLANIGGSTIPASGGTLTYTFTAYNPSVTNIVFDVWTEVELPNYSFYGPLLARSDVSLEPYENLSRTIDQNVPASAPGGYFYYYYGYAGNFETLQIYHTNFFIFSKSYSGDGRTGDWNCSGWTYENRCQDNVITPDRVSLSASPNPFNPSTTISFDLPEASQVTLSVFNQAGQIVASLINGYRVTGRHEVTWDATGIPSGVYLVALSAGNKIEVQKIVLLK